MTLAYVFYTFSTNGLAQFIVWALLVALIAVLVAWGLRYFGAPDVAAKLVYAIAAVVIVFALFDVIGHGPNRVYVP